MCHISSFIYYSPSLLHCMVLKQFLTFCFLTSSGTTINVEFNYLDGKLLLTFISNQTKLCCEFSQTSVTLTLPSFQMPSLLIWRTPALLFLGVPSCSPLTLHKMQIPPPRTRPRPGRHLLPTHHNRWTLKVAFIHTSCYAVNSDCAQLLAKLNLEKKFKHCFNISLSSFCFLNSLPELVVCFVA